MFKTIVVGAAGSEHAPEAIALALRLRGPSGRLILAAVHPGAGPRRDELGLADVPPGVPAERRAITSDSPGPALNALAVAEGADLIVLGSTHRGRLAIATGRTTVQHMLADAPCALAVAAEDQELRSPDGLGLIAVAHDGSPSAELAADKAYELAADTGARVRLVSVVDPVIYMPFAPVPVDPVAEEEERVRALSALEAVAARAPEGVEVDRVVPLGRIADTLMAAVQDCDLLVMGSRHLRPPLRVLAGSASLCALTDGRVPVLVMPRASAAAEGAAAA